MKNRIASLFLVFALLMSLCAGALARDNPITVQSGGAERFTDVPTSHWAYGYINKVVGSGLFNGRTESTFEPSSAMTRSQFVMVMARMEGRSDLEGVVTQTIFPDVATTRRAAGPIKWATDEGFVNGFGDGTFKPDSPITRGQFAALIHRYITYKRYADLDVLDPEPDPFTDAASVSTAFTADVEFARVHGLLTGYSDGTVRAGNPITRAAIAAILARFLDLVTESGYTPLMDGPDNGDTGDTDSPPIEAPSSYDGLTVKVNNPTHGATPIVRATRDGVLVAGDDLQEGDRVTVTHTPNSGYTASMRVRDGQKKVVAVTKTDANTSWFTMPKLRTSPVTVTVTYAKTSSGGGGGGNGGSSSGGSGTGGNGETTALFYWNVPTPTYDTEKGSVWFSTTPITAANFDTLTKSTSLSNQSKETSPFTFYAVLTPANATYNVGCTADNATLLSVDTTTFAPSKVYTFQSANANTGTDHAVTVTVRPVFKAATESENTDAPTLSVAKAWASSVSDAVKADYSLDTLGDVTYSGELAGGSTITLKVPYTDDGYFRYQIDSVQYVYQDLDGNEQTGTATPGDANADTWVQEYTFAVPYDALAGSEIKVTAYYKVNENENLTYTVNVTLSGTGTGSVALTIADGATTVKESASPADLSGIGLPATMKEYVELYSEKDFYDEEAWSVPFSATATQDPDSTLQSMSVSPDTGKLESGKAVTVTASFKKVQAYGYKLTVIGDGSVTVDFKKGSAAVEGTAAPVRGNADGTPAVFTSGLIDGANSTLTLTATATVDPQQPDRWVPDPDNPSGSISLTANEVKDIVIVFRDTTALPVLFTVNVGSNGSVAMTAQNGAIMTKADGDAVTGKTLKEALDSAPISSAEIPVQSDNVAHSYYALSGTIVTLTPSYGSSYKVKSITVTDSAKKPLYDISEKTGYSFQLPAGVEAPASAADADVQFGRYSASNAYEVMVAAPTKNWKAPEDKISDGLYAYSTNIAEGTKIEDILNALNNEVKDKAGIESKFHFTPSNLASFLTTFLLSENSEGKAYTETLQEQLSQPIADSIDIAKMIDAQKTKALSGLESEVGKSLPDNNPIERSFPVTNDTASSVVGAVLRDLFNKKPALEAAYNPDSNPFTVVITYLEPKVKSADANDGQSMEAQLISALNAYASNLTVVQNRDFEGIEPAVTISVVEDKVEEKAYNNRIVISAKANFTTGEAPIMNWDDVKFSAYADKFDLYASVKAQVLNNGEPIADYEYDNVLPFSYFDDALAELAKNNPDGGNPPKKASEILDDIKEGLTGVDQAVQNKWYATFSDDVVKNGMTVDMSTVLNKDMLDIVIEETVLKKAIKKVANSVEAIRNYDDTLDVDDPRTYTDDDGNKYSVPKTHEAFMSLYNQLVVVREAVEVEKDEEGKETEVKKIFIELKKYDPDKKAPSSDSFSPLGSTDEDGNLVLTFAFDQILADTTAANNTSFEQLMSLLVGVRSGIAADVQSSGSGKTPESVFAGMLEGQLGKSNRGTMEINKWGQTPPVTQGSMEAREVSELLAKLILSNTSGDINTAWSAFEEQGYQSVAFSVGLDTATTTSMKGRVLNALQGLDDSLKGLADFRAGFKVTQVIGN